MMHIRLTCERTEAQSQTLLFLAGSLDVWCLQRPIRTLSGVPVSTFGPDATALLGMIRPLAAKVDIIRIALT